jgi:hypothetical protein
MLTTKNLPIVELGALSPTQVECHDKIADRLNDLNDTWDIRVVKDMPPFREISDRVVMGSFSRTDMVNRVKYIYPQHAMLVPDIIKPVTASQLARAYLWVKFGNKRHRMRKSQYGYIVRGRKTHPLYAMPQHIDEAIYVDIKAAYFHILLTLGLNPDYLPHKWLGRGVTVTDFPYSDQKLTRNMIVSGCLPGHSTIWEKGEIIHRRTSSSTVNLMLWSVVMDVLHTFARDMIKIGAVYVHTDGYILDAKHIGDVDALARKWRIPMGVKYMGECKVIGPSAYTFYGQHEHRTRRKDSRPCSNIAPVPGEWMREAFVEWYDHSPQPYELGVRGL